MKDLSVIILSYNTKDITERCLESLFKSIFSNNSLSVEIILIDNASQDGSADMIDIFVSDHQASNIEYKVLRNKENLGFVRGNNKGVELSDGKYILFLNSDVIVESVDFSNVIQFIEEDDEIGALTVRVDIPKGGIDPASHRGFPTPWNAFCYFGKLEAMFGRMPIIGQFIRWIPSHSS